MGNATTALDLYNSTLKDCANKTKDIDNNISDLKLQIHYCENRIDRYNNKDFAEDFTEDNDRKRQIFLEYIESIYPYKSNNWILNYSCYPDNPNINLISNKQKSQPD